MIAETSYSMLTQIDKSHAIRSMKSRHEDKNHLKFSVCIR